MCLEGDISEHPLNGGEFILFWHSPERQNYFHLAILRHQNVHIFPEQKWLGFCHFLAIQNSSIGNLVTH